MHDTAYRYARLFFQLYWNEHFRDVVELGSYDVNGSMKDHAPAGANYLGVDMEAGPGVDLVVRPTDPLPLADESVDVIVTSSCFEHDMFFWETFLDLVRVLRPGGLLYLNAPSNGVFHRFPLDCWRFYPDAGVALVEWAGRKGQSIELLESFVGLPERENWADFVAVFRKGGGPALIRKGRIADHAPAMNIHTAGVEATAPLERANHLMPDALALEEARAKAAKSAPSASQGDWTAPPDRRPARVRWVNGCEQRTVYYDDEAQWLQARGWKLYGGTTGGPESVCWILRRSQAA